MKDGTLEKHTGLTINAGTTLSLTFDGTVDAPTGTSGEYDNVAQITASDRYGTFYLKI